MGVIQGTRKEFLKIVEPKKVKHQNAEITELCLAYITHKLYTRIPEKELREYVEDQLE